MNEKVRWLCVVGGKSGGHIVPGLELARQARVADPALKILFISTNTPLDKSIVVASRHIDKHVCLGISDKPGLMQRMLTLPLLAFAGMRSLMLLITKRPVRIISMGGMVSVPVCLAGWMLRIPITLYELNATPGRAISFLARFAQKICVCFNAAKQYFPMAKVCRVEYPVRFDSQAIPSQAEARASLHIPVHDHVLLVLGGSQGSRFLNEFAQRYARHAVLKGQANKLFILHQAGDNEVATIIDIYQKLGIAAAVYPYVHDIERDYAAADVCIARAGAGTLFELLFFKKPALIIPLETASTDHQRDNAEAIVEQEPQLFYVMRQPIVEQSPSSAYAYLDKQLC